MFRKILFPLILAVLAYGFWISPDFKAISAGVAIFLFGMLSLEEGFKTFSGGLLERILQKSTDKLYKSIGFGLLSTTIMQSSSLVSLLTISFLGAGLIGLAQAIGIIFGANLGTTTGAWLVAGLGLKVNISTYAMPLLVFGVLFIFQKSKSLKGVGYILAGLGFLFLGIHYMKEGFEAFESTLDLASFGGTGLKYLFIFTGIGVFATVVMQSSHATLVLIITALSVGQISYENALALAIGANIGTTITAILGAMSSNIVGKQLAGAHLIFNMVTGVIAIVFIEQMMYAVDISSAFLGIAHDDYTLKLAVFHTIFNLIGVIVMVPFIDKLVRFLEAIIKSSPTNDEGYDSVKYLNDSVLQLPTTSMIALINETKHLYTNAFTIIVQGLHLKQSNVVSEMPLDEVVRDSDTQGLIDIDAYYTHNIKGVYGEILDFSTRAQSLLTQPKDIEVLYKLKLANRDIVEAVKGTKHLQKNLIKYSKSRNTQIKAQYDMIRQGLAELLRNIHTIASSQEEDKILLLLSTSKVHIEKYDIASNGTLDTLIRNHWITNEMATSLMNDTTYAYDISKNLIEMAKVLFIENHHEMMMSDEDVDLILKKAKG